MRGRFPILVCSVALLAASGAWAQPAGTPANDAGPVASARISLDAAVAAAERHVQGKASKAEYERQKGGQWVYDVEVVAGPKVFDVKVDPDKGTVIASTEDRADADHDGDADD